MYKAGDIAKRLDIHPNTVRNWSDEYTRFLSGGAVGKAPGTRRRYNDQDALVLATIASLRNQGLKPAQIVEALENGRLVETLPPLPTAEEEAARASIELVAMPEYTRVLDQLRSAELEKQRIITERDSAYLARDKANERIAELQHEIGQLQGRLEALESERLPTRSMLQIILVIAIGSLVVVAVVVVLVAGR